MRTRALLAALALTTTLLLGGITASNAASPAAAPAPITLSGIDLHDGMVQQVGSTYYLYGTEYGCGYQWYVASPWCGYGVSTASSLSGPWSTPVLLFPPSEADPVSHSTFNAECGTTDGHGCFNPRMEQRPDGVWILYFNEVNGRSSTTTAAYWAMGCNSPTGPCGASAGAPYGSTHKMGLHQCNGNNGDFAIGTDTSGAVLICSYGGTLSEERLDQWWTNGTGTGSTVLAGLAGVEGPGVYQDAASGKWLMTYSDPNCGYCNGAGTGYATATSLMGPWTAPASTAVAAPVATGRRDISATSCGGQTRTVSILDGQPYQDIDLWVGTRNETAAGLVLAPLTYTPPSSAAPTPAGQNWVPPLAFAC